MNLTLRTLWDAACALLVTEQPGPVFTHRSFSVVFVTSPRSDVTVLLSVDQWKYTKSSGRLSSLINILIDRIVRRKAWICWYIKQKWEDRTWNILLMKTWMSLQQIYMIICQHLLAAAATLSDNISVSLFPVILQSIWVLEYYWTFLSAVNWHWGDQRRLANTWTLSRKCAPFRDGMLWYILHTFLSSLNPWFSEMCEVSGEDYVNCDEVVSQTSDNDIDTNEDDDDEVRSGPEDSQEYWDRDRSIELVCQSSVAWKVDPLTNHVEHQSCDATVSNQCSL